jgi:DNA-binding transcriptional LysR family regulator
MNLLDPQLKAFVAVVTHHTVHAAAEVLYLTQTAVTQRIQALEARLKTTLFIRTRKGMEITADGEALLRYCFAASELEGETLSKLTGVRQEAEIHLCISAASSVMRSRIIPACLPVLSKFPNLLMRFLINDVENRHLALRSAECQLAVLQLEDASKEFEQKILKPERYVLVCTAKWKKRKLKDILQEERIIDFDPSDQVTFNYLKHFDLMNLARKDRYFVNQTEAIAELVVGGYGYSLLTKEFAEAYVQQGKIFLLNKGRIYENPLALAWYARPQMPKYFAALIQAIN